jgi:predicted component of type VI protein secretion system
VTTLIIYRGETQVAQVTLTGKPMKIGRGKDNDIVLEDPGKGVSRVHAELRPEGDRYRLVDLQSQNGTWVSGQRVPSVLLAPGVVAAMGPFRVAIDASSPLTQAFAIPKPETFPDTGTEFSRPLPPRPSDEPEPVPVGSSDALLDDLAPADVHPPAPMPPVGPPAAKAAPAAAPAAAARRSAPSADAGARSRTMMVAVAALVVMLVCAVGGYALLKRRAKPPVWDATVAAALADSGRCQEALDQQINRALAAEPNNAEALRLKAKCTAPPQEPTTTTVPPVTVTATNKDKLDAAEVALQSNACQAALDAAKEVLAADANDQRAQDVAKKATDCLNPPQPQRANGTVDPVVRVAPAQGGLDPLPGETGKQYKARVDGMGKRYEDAVALLQAQKYQQALTELNGIAGQVPPGYRDLAQRRGEARNGISEESNRAYAAAQQAEQRQEWKTALAQYQRAQTLDPARDVSADVARVNDARIKAGHQLCQTADAAFSLGHASDAIDRYNKALELLSSSDECYARAKERLKTLGR